MKKAGLHRSVRFDIGKKIKVQKRYILVDTTGPMLHALVLKRWVVERTLVWLSRCRRLAKDWACLNRKARAFPLLASIRLMVRRLGRNVG